MNFIEQIYEFNQRAGLLDKPYDDFLESSFQIEEALEGFDMLYFSKDLQDKFKAPRSFDDMSPKDISRAIIKSTGEFTGSDVDRLDKACDAIVFAFGSILKLGLKPAQAAQAINIVMSANLSKLGMPKDEHGKLMKPEGFIGPEVQLQALLEERDE